MRVGAGGAAGAPTKYGGRLARADGVFSTVVHGLLLRRPHAGPRGVLSFVRAAKP